MYIKKGKNKIAKYKEKNYHNSSDQKSIACGAEKRGKTTRYVLFHKNKINEAMLALPVSNALKVWLQK